MVIFIKVLESNESDKSQRNQLCSYLIVRPESTKMEIQSELSKLVGDESLDGKHRFFIEKNYGFGELPDSICMFEVFMNRYYGVIVLESIIPDSFKWDVRDI